MNEQEALARLRRGDIGGLEMLVRQYQVQALRVAYLITRDRHLAEDVVQEAFLRAYERIHQFDGTRPFGPWFFRLIANQALKAINARQREVHYDESEDGMVAIEELLPDPGPGPEDIVAQDEVRQQVWEALGRLSPAQRTAVVLRYYLEFSEEEIAKEMNCSRGTVKRHLHDARQRLRKWSRVLVKEG
ncbi:MAG: RNA polymerase sigma factor [Thermoflexales bacterium]|nr:RNA polymerase sigma factor [Thermoflexales bacterium]